MDVPDARAKVTQLQEGGAHETCASAFKLVSRCLTGNAFALRFRFQQIGNPLGNEYAGPVIAIRVADHASTVDGQRAGQQFGMKGLSRFNKLGQTFHHAILNIRCVLRALWIWRATAAATGGGKALPICRYIAVFLPENAHSSGKP